MDRRITVALVVVCALLITLTWWLSRPQAAPATQTGGTTPTIAPLWTVDQTTITGIDLANATTKVNLQKDSQGNWVVMSSFGATADQDSVTAVLGRIASMNVMNDLGENLNAADYGFTQATTVTITTADQKTYVIEVGDKTPVQNGYYVRLPGTKRIYIVATYFLMSSMDWLANPPLPATPTPTETQTPAMVDTPTISADTTLATATP